MEHTWQVINQFVICFVIFRVQAGSGCGFATFGKLLTVHPDIAWAKLGAMAEGAKIAAIKVNKWFMNLGSQIYVP